MRIERYRPSDLAQIGGRGYERELQRLTGHDYSQTFATGPAFTAWDTVPRFAGGVVPLWKGVGEGWLYLSPWIEARPLTLYRTIRAIFGAILDGMEFRRVQAPICVTMEKNIRLVEHLGFKSEGDMAYWGPDGKDYRMYALTNQGKRVCLQQS